MSSIIMNVFRQQPFSGVTLTEEINKFPYLPGMLGQMNIFEEEGVRTTSVVINERDGALSLIPTSPRGAPINQRINDYRNSKLVPIPRIAIADTIYAEELQNVLSDNADGTLMSLQDEVARRTTGPTGLTSLREFTLENHRIGGVLGQVLDADGATIVTDSYALFGISKPAEYVFDLAVPVIPGTATALPTSAAPGRLRGQFNQVVRDIQVAARGAFIPGRTEVHALCGHAFFDALVQHPDVIQTYLNWTGAAVLRDNQAFSTFFFGGIYWHDYRGSDDGTMINISTNHCYFFPVKAPGVFKLYWGPGEGFPTLNQPGIPMYMYRDMDPAEEQAWVRFTLKSYPLHLCTRPEMLRTGTMDTTAD